MGRGARSDRQAGAGDRVKYPDEILVQELRKRGQFLADQPFLVLQWLIQCGADPDRAIEPGFDYQGRTVSMPAQLADLLLAAVLLFASKRSGRLPKYSTLLARHFEKEYGLSKHKAAEKAVMLTEAIDKVMGDEDAPLEHVETVRVRLAARKQKKLRQPPSPRGPSRKSSSRDASAHKRRPRKPRR
jgi:hypothetical protein